MVLVDLNHDGVDDIVATNRSDDAVSVLFGDGAGGFGLPVSYAAGNEPTDIATGDFNGDGHADVVTANYDSSDVSVLLGDGAGGFLPQLEFLVGVDPIRVVTTDLNADGAPDLVVLAEEGFASEDGLIVMVGKGDGTFLAPQRTSMPGGAIDVGMGDWDGDGDVDLVVVNPFGDSVSLLFGNGDGTFQPVSVMMTGDFPRSITVGDVDSDGLSDPLVSCFQPSVVQLLRGQPGGSFSSASAVIQAELVESVLADVDGDGALDLVSPRTVELDSGEGYQSWIDVRPGQNDGSFATAQSYLKGQTPGRVIVRDVNSDGRSDMLAVNQGTHAISVQLTHPDGSFRSRTDLSMDALASGVAIADLDEDGIPDLVASSQNSGPIASPTRIFRGQGDGSFADPLLLEFGIGNAGIAATDLDGDGHADLALASSVDDAVSVLLGHGDETFASGVQHPVGDDPRKVVVADLNGDGIPNLLTPNFGSDSVSMLVGGPGAKYTPAPGLATGRRPTDLAVADVNGDAWPDIVVANSSTTSAEYTVSVFLGAGDATFGIRSDIVIDAGFALRPYAVAIADVDDDGANDLLVGCWLSPFLGPGGGQVAVLLGLGDGSFTAPTFEPAGNTLRDIDVADLDDDGFLDIIAADASDYGGTISVLYGLGDGSFRPREVYANGGQPSAVVAGDLNGDGAKDLVAIGHDNGLLSILLAMPDTPCQVDVTGDGQLNIFDITAFIAIYNAADPGADLAEPYGVLNVFDVMAYINLYIAGCP